MTGQLTPIRKVVLAIGSNLGDREANLAGAVESLAETPDLVLRGVSRVYASEPVDAPAGSPEFYNAVVVADTMLSAQMLLERAMAIEDTYGRERGERNAPRTLDVDLVVVGDLASDTDDLRLPHPRAHERAFVVVPWLEVDPEGHIPGRGTLAELLPELDTSTLRVVTGVDLQRT
jgi:2-amino-4-hydroxy-6-hydroxymethyldihydropteridine diphosphokinase